jgi:histidyl-tRNA synthetase
MGYYTQHLIRIIPESDATVANYKRVSDAIKKEIESNGKRKVEDAKKEDKKLAKETEKIVEEANKRKKEKDKLKKVLEEILEYIKEHKGEPELLKPIVTKLKELGYTDPRTIDKIDDALEVLELTK